MPNWAQIVSEIINVVAAGVFMILFTLYLIHIRRLSETRRFLHLYPYRRACFVVIFIVVNFVEVVLFFLLNISDSSLFNTIQFYFLLGTCLNSLILMFQLYILYVEIKKEKPFNIIHVVYWFYLVCITLSRLVLEAFYENNLDVTVWELVLSSLLFADSLALLIYSWFMRRYEIQEFGNNATQQFKMLNESTKFQEGDVGNSYREKVCEGFPRITDASYDGTFPYLTTQVKLYSETQFVVITSSTGNEIAREIKNVDQLMGFYMQTQRFNLKRRMKMKGVHIDLIDLQAYFQQLLSNWNSYQQFVLQFLNVKGFVRMEINRCRSQNSQHSQTATFDPACIYFDIKIPNFAKIIDHFQFDIIVCAVNHQQEALLHKRYSEFEDLDKRLRAIELGGFKLKPPELPEKIYVNQDDQEKLDDRKIKLELYIRRILNDKVFVKSYQQPRLLLFNFFKLKRYITNMAKENLMLVQFSQYSFEPQSLIKEVTEKGEPVTFYYFNIRLKGQRVGLLKKRFRMFDEFNQELKRWMHNNQTEYKTIQLPSKIPHSSQPQKKKRHHLLADYLNALVRTIPNLGEFYEARRFLLVYQEIGRMSERSSLDHGLLRKSSGQSLLESSYMSRMSQMIEDLKIESLAL